MLSNAIKVLLLNYIVTIVGLAVVAIIGYVIGGIVNVTPLLVNTPLADASSASVLGGTALVVSFFVSLIKG